LFFHATKMQPNSMDTADMWTYWGLDTPDIT
jgi:hypothetical protein